MVYIHWLLLQTLFIWYVLLADLAVVDQWLIFLLYSLMMSFPFALASGQSQWRMGSQVQICTHMGYGCIDHYDTDGG